MPGSDLFDKA